MPATIPPAHDWLANELTALKRRVRVLESRPTTTIYNPSSGVPSTVTAHPIITMGQQIDGTYGHRTFDASGNTRVVVGQMPATGVGSTYAGDYGVLLANSDGSTQALLPMQWDFSASGVSTSSTSLVALAGSPQVTATLGASGDCLVTMGATITCAPTAISSAVMALFVDGGEASGGGAFPYVILTNVTSNDAIQASCSRVMQLSKIYQAVTPGPHTFSIEYMSSGGGTATFGVPFLMVQPI